MEKVAVVVLNFRLRELTLKCINSVRKSSYKNIQIILVDNNSQDNIAEDVKLKDLIFIQNDQNSGYAGGNNLGIRKALDEAADYIFILNPDTTVREDTIEGLVRGLKEHQAQIGNPKIYFGDSKKIWFAGGIFDRANVLGSNRGVDQIDEGQYDHDEEIELGTGAALMVKSEVFSKIGLFDERYFLYYEDTDFCLKAKQAGFKIMYLPQAVVYHDNAKSTGLGSPLQDYFITRNRMLLASKFLPFRTQFALFREALRNLGNPVRRLALWDFFMGSFGKGSFIK